MPNDRSDAALRERLEIAGKAAQEVGTTLWKDYQTAPRELCILDAFNERILTMEDYTEVATARHIAASSPDVVKADIEEILALRAENERLNKEADWLAESLDIITRFCAPEVINDLKYKSWREAARNAVEKLNG